MYHIFFVCSSVYGYLGCFCVLAVVNSAAMNIGAPVFFQIVVFSRFMPRNGMAVSFGNSIFCFFFKEPPYCSLEWLHFHKQCRRVPFSLHPLQHLFVDFVMMAILILIGVR